jgi:hypothetical protein
MDAGNLRNTVRTYAKPMPRDLPLEIFHQILSYVGDEGVMAYALTCRAAYHGIVPTTINYHAIKVALRGGQRDTATDESLLSRWRFLRILEREDAAHSSTRYACFYSGRLIKPVPSNCNILTPDPCTKRAGPTVRLSLADRVWSFAWSDIYRIMQTKRNLLSAAAGLPLSSISVPFQHWTTEPVRLQYLQHQRVHYGFSIDAVIRGEELYLHVKRHYMHETPAARICVLTAAHALLSARADKCIHLNRRLPSEADAVYEITELDMSVSERIMRAALMARSCVSQRLKDAAPVVAATVEHLHCGHCDTEFATTIFAHDRSTVEIVSDTYYRIGRCENPTDLEFWAENRNLAPRGLVASMESASISRLFATQIGSSPRANGHVIQDYARCGMEMIWNGRLLQPRPRRQIFFFKP